MGLVHTTSESPKPLAAVAAVRVQDRSPAVQEMTVIATNCCSNAIQFCLFLAHTAFEKQMHVMQ